ncbi:MAG: 2-oxoacid:acceptor oxidoreductase family protein [Candidatus Rokubacteria bacterium]|nr:2-oxoacid:acceptor oxidoreductase family protein [Candidatus Rokubacteria bacterium]
MSQPESASRPATAGTTAEVVGTRMLELRVHGRGGQGAQVGCQILAGAFFRAGRWVQAFAAYGGERRGAPVTAAVRVDGAPIHLRCDVEHADVAVVLDATLLGLIDPASLAPDALVVVNAPAAPCGRLPGVTRIVAIDAAAIARRHRLGPIVATAMIGAFAAASRLLTLEELLPAIEEWSPVKKAENTAACTEAYAEMTALEGRAP